MKKWLLFVILFLGLSGYSLSADYYVDNSCTYNGNGTSQVCATGGGQAGPFNSLANAQNGVTGSRPDDKLLFKAGQVYNGTFAIQASGTAGHPFTISSYGTGAKPIFDGQGQSNYPNLGTVNIVNLSHIIIDGLDIRNSSFGVWIYKADGSNPTTGFIIRNCIVHDNSTYGISYYTEPGLSRADLSDSAIHNNECYNNASGIYGHRVNGLSIFRNISRDNAITGSENYGIAIEAGSYNKIYENIISNNWTQGIGIYGDFASDGQSDYNQIYRNVITGTKWQEWAADIAWQGQVGANNAIYNNLLLSSDARAWHFYDDTISSSGNMFYGNTLANGERGMLTSGAVWDVKNNIFYNIQTPVSGSNLLFANNISFPSATGVSNPIMTDPMFTNPSGNWTGYTLQTGSPAIDAGFKAAEPYNAAIDPLSVNFPAVSDQNAAGAGWEIGAFVYASTSPSPCTPLPDEQRTVACPVGYVGSIIEKRISTCPGPTWGEWTVVSNTCTLIPPQPCCPTELREQIGTIIDTALRQSNVQRTKRPVIKRYILTNIPWCQ